MTDTEVKLKLLADYEEIHGLVLSEEHKQKMVNELSLDSFIRKVTEYVYLGYYAKTVIG